MWSPSGLPGIHVVQTTKILPKSIDILDGINRKLWDRTVNRAIKQLGWQQPDLWVNNQLLWPIAAEDNRSRWGRILYDITDDWTAAGGTESWLAQVTRDDEAMSQIADAVVVCSQSLYNGKTQRFRDKLSLVPNGVDIDHFAKVDTATAAADIQKLPDAELTLGYSGTAHPDRLDVALVASIAKTNPQWPWVFIGPNHLTNADRAELDLPNVHFIGTRRYHELPTYLAGIDVCVTPHRVTAFTESLNPIKLWEYLAVGKPIVSTPVAGFRDFSDHVTLATSAEEWGAALHAITDMTDDRIRFDRDCRRQIVNSHGWPVRVDQIEAILTGTPHE
jgi:glycosyltransferase involved in cell wall biosynthesis